MCPDSSRIEVDKTLIEYMVNGRSDTMVVDFARSF